MGPSKIAGVMRLLGSGVVQNDIIEALESTRGYIDGMIADARREGNEEDALDYITQARRLRVKGLQVLEASVRNAAFKVSSWDTIAQRSGLDPAELRHRYPEAAAVFRQAEEARNAFGDDDPPF